MTLDDVAALDPNLMVNDLLEPGVDVDLTNCDREPIHLSGQIQPHGVALAVSGTDLVVRAASENSPQLLGVAALDLLGLPLLEALGAVADRAVRVALLDLRGSGQAPLHTETARGQSIDLTWFRTGDLVVLEIEPAAPMDLATMATLFETANQAMQTTSSATDVASICAATAAEIRNLTGYDRVMVYRFHPDWHGEVVAEERAEGLGPLLGLHYPSTDIPRQARRLFLLNPLRMIGDVGYRPANLVDSPGSEVLDLSLSRLRSVSPIHLEYLRNMGVQATLTISLSRGSRLWGMVACHHYSPRFIGSQLRSSLRVFAQAAGTQVVAQEDLDHRTYAATLADDEVKVLARMSRAESLSVGLTAGELNGLVLAGADGMITRIDGRTATAGDVPPGDAVALLLANLRSGSPSAEFVCHDLPHRLPELAPYAQQAAGVIAMSLSSNYEDFICWFRGEWTHTVTWAGNPDKTVTVPVTGGRADPGQLRLTPRRSFEAWEETVHGQCRPWLPAEVDTARHLAHAVPDLQVARAQSHVAHLAELARREVETRQAVEAALRENQVRLEQLAGSTAVGFFVCTTTPPAFVYLNAGMRGLLDLSPSADDPSLAQFIAAVHADDRQRALDVFAVANAGPATQTDLRIVNGADALRWIRVTSNPVEVAGGPAQRVAGTVENVTTHKLAEEALRDARQSAVEANLAKTEFLTRMSHELRTPLNAVLGFAQLLELDPLSDLQDDAVSHILRGGRHLLDLVSDVMDVSRVESGQLELSIRAVSVVTLLVDTVGLLMPAAADRRIAITFDPSAADFDHYATGDERRLRQVMLNLLSNAIKYNRPGGRIDVTCHLSDGQVHIDVTDTGPGIRAEDLPRLFTPFDRLGEEASNVEGTGIGLVLSRRLMELMDGRLEATSVFGTGSTFTLTMPRADAPETALGATASPTTIR
jgi:light-regulated signal transduction histidine kinase (bacteriophytochrome)